MARGINKVILVGNVGADPEVRYMPNGNAVASLSIATSETWKDKQTGEKQDRTEWHRAVLYNRLGEIAGEYVKKGAKVYVEGSLRTRKWQDQQGIERYTTEIIVSDMQLLDGRSVAGNDVQAQQAPSQNRYQAKERPQAAPHQQAAPAAMSEPEGFELLDDDIPF